MIEIAVIFDRKTCLSPGAEAVAMDPQQRQLLERGYSALHGAGMVESSLLGSGAAVSVGRSISNDLR